MKKSKTYFLFFFISLIFLSCGIGRKKTETNKPVAKISISPNNALVKAKIIQWQGDNEAKIQVIKYLSLGNSFFKPSNKTFIVQINKTKVKLDLNQEFEGEISCFEKMGGSNVYKILYAKTK